MTQFAFIKENTIHILLGFFVLVFVISVILSSIFLLNQNSVEVNVIEDQTYDRTVSLERNGGSTTFFVQINPISDNPMPVNSSQDSPTFPEVTPSQNYVIPQTGIFDNKIFLFGLVYALPSFIAWVLFRRFVINKI